jgi:hypothetical protein
MGSGGLAVVAVAIGCLGAERRGERFFRTWTFFNRRPPTTQSEVGRSAAGHIAAPAEQEDPAPPGHPLIFFFWFFFWFFWFFFGFFLVFFGQKQNSKFTMFHCGPFSKKKKKNTRKNVVRECATLTTAKNPKKKWSGATSYAPLHFFLGFFASNQKSDPVFRCAPKFGAVGTKKIHIFGQYLKSFCTKNRPQTEI